MLSKGGGGWGLRNTQLGKDFVRVCLTKQREQKGTKVGLRRCRQIISAREPCGKQIKKMTKDSCLHLKKKKRHNFLTIKKGKRENGGGKKGIILSMVVRRLAFGEHRKTIKKGG